MELIVKNISGKDTEKKIKLSEKFLQIQPNDHAIYLDVKHYLAAQRQGTSKTKERWEIRGSTRKIKKQKGTGGARAGSLNSPTIVGGAKAFGPRPRDYSFKLNKKIKQLARLSALSYKFKENNILVLEDFSLETPKTKEYTQILKNLNLLEKKTVFIFPELNKNVYLSSRNLMRSRVILLDQVNTHDILDAQVLVFMESSAKSFFSTIN